MFKKNPKVNGTKFSYATTQKCDSDLGPDTLSSEVQSISFSTQDTNTRNQNFAFINELTITLNCFFTDSSL